MSMKEPPGLIQFIKEGALGRLNNFEDVFAPGIKHKLEVAQVQLDNGLTFLKNMADYLKRYCSLERDGALDVQKHGEVSNEKKIADKDRMAMHLGAFHAIENLILNVAKNRVEFTHKVDHDCVEPTYTFVKEARNAQSRLLTEGEKALKLLNEVRKENGKIRNAAYKQWLSLQEEHKEMKDTEEKEGKDSKHLPKLQKNFKASRLKTIKAFAKLEAHTKKVNLKQIEYFEKDLHELTQKWEQLEVQRLNFWEKCMERFASHYRDLVRPVDSYALQVETAVGSIDTKKELAQFVADVVKEHGKCHYLDEEIEALPCPSNVVTDGGQKMLDLLDKPLTDIVPKVTHQPGAEVEATDYAPDDEEGQTEGGE